jgi:hypothetical protein
MTTVYFRLIAEAVVWPVILLVSPLLVLPFGRQVAIANILLDVRAAVTPLGSWKVHLINPPTSGQLGRDVVPLMHSVL